MTDTPSMSGARGAARQISTLTSQNTAHNRSAAPSDGSSDGAAIPAARSQAQVVRAARAQLDKRLDAIARSAALLAGQSDQAAAARRAIADIQSDAQHARSLTEALERLVALEHVAMRLGQVEVSDLLIATLSRWKTRAPRQTFELALPGHEPTLLGDGALIEQAIEALIAWAAAQSGAGDIRVSLRAPHLTENSAAGEVTIAVRCPLPAVSASDLARLVERLAEPLADGAGELELGLACAVAERHGGRTWVECEPDEQAITLLLALPVAPNPAILPQSATHVHSGAEPDELAAHGDAPALSRARSIVVVAHGDARMARYLRANLDAADFTAKSATSLGASLKLIEQEEPDLILLDLALPDDEGRDPLARTLARSTAPIIALGQSADPATCVRALDAGAVDFIAQPLSVEETLARARRALRPQRGQAREPRQRIFTCGDLVIDDAQRLVTVGGAPTQLSKTEYRLLRTLAQNLGKTLSHEMLLAQVWGPAYSQEIEFIWVYIRRLRRKIEPDPARPRYILTAPGVGYRLAQPSRAE